MSSPPDLEPTTAAVDVLAEPRRRSLLAVLLEREESSPAAAPRTHAAMSIADLAIEVAAAERGCPIVPDEHCERIHIELVHRHVPRLVDVGVLRRDDDGEPTVSLADHPIHELEWVRTLLADPAGDAFPGDEERLERTLEALRHPQRRTVCTVLASRRGPVAVEEVAAEVDATERAGSAVATMLVHEHLPLLADAGLVAYAEGARRAALRTDAPHWTVDWLVEGPLAEAAALVESESNEAPDTEHEPAPGTTTPSDESERAGPDVEGCWTIEGAADVSTRGEAIADRADEELFVMAPDAALLRSRCLENMRDATDRGVDVYVASRTPRVRDTIRSAVPAATVCEPRFDWFAFPAETPQSGYVMLADREAAMLVTVETAGSDGDVSRVGAITGDGRANALVTVVREQLGPRLDRLPSAGDGPDETPLPM